MLILNGPAILEVERSEYPYYKSAWYVTSMITSLILEESFSDTELLSYMTDEVYQAMINARSEQPRSHVVSGQLESTSVTPSASSERNVRQ